jgi:hypothetical protein
LGFTAILGVNHNKADAFVSHVFLAASLAAFIAFKKISFKIPLIVLKLIFVGY